MSDQSERREQIPGEIRAVRAADGARLEYEIAGDGPPLVMLHGLLASRFAFSRQRAALAARHRLILISFRGHDGSDNLVPANYGVGTSDVHDLRAVLDAEGLERAHLLGHSSGGATAFVFATQSPERVGRAVLLEPSLFALLPPADRSQIVADTAMFIAVAEAEGPEACLRAVIDHLGGEAWRGIDAETQAKRLAGMARTALMVGPHVGGLLDLKVTDADVTTLRTPTLLLYGAASFSFEAIIADRIRTLRPDLRVLTVEQAGHNVHRDRADIVNAEVLAFLAS